MNSPHPRPQELLQQSEMRFRLLVESVIDYAIFMLNTDGFVATWNAGAQRIKGYAADEIIGRHFSTFYPPDEIAARKPQRELEIAAAVGRFEEEGWRLRKDGSRFWANVVITALRDEDGILRGFGKVTRDLTERRRGELELMEAKVAAEKASEAKSDFLSRISHELRTPLNSMLILSRLLMENNDNRLSPMEVKYAETIYDAGHDLLGLINDLLDVARIEAGADTPLHVTEIDLARLHADLEGKFGQLALEKNLSFHIIKEDGVPETIRTDERRLMQILRNLLSNAFKFTRAGGVTLRIDPASSGWTPGRQALDDAPQVLAFSVTDTGVGIPEDKQGVIFEAFQQADSGTAREFGGTGLGLTITREATDILGGEMRVSSEVGKGSRFVLYLPIAPA